MPSLGHLSTVRSVRLKLLLLALLPLVVLLPLLLGITMFRWIDKFDDLLIAKIASDLNVAEQYFGRIEETQTVAVSALLQSVEFSDKQKQGQAALAEFLEIKRKEMGLDFLFYEDENSDQMPSAARPLIKNATAARASGGLAVFSYSDLEQISPALAERATIPLVPTEAARSISRETETRGMLILSAQRDETGGNVLLGGRLLNRNLDVIDTMNDLIYHDEFLSEAGRIGTTTLFLDDVRISTNVRLFEGERALGTRVSEVVWQDVMGKGQTWLDRAFVVNDWYISGYVPLTDMDGKRIGMLYTGFLEAPFTLQRNTTILSLILAFVLVVCLSVPFFLRLARGIFAPLETIATTMERAEKGEFDARIGHVSSSDEIGTVARHLDRLLDQVQDRDEKLRSYAENLNELVDQRTQELKAANTQLEDTFAQLVMLEKLASIGEITAGVAHEINNPLAVIQGNLEVLRNGIGEEALNFKTEFDLIDAQTHRINIIVAKLLNFTKLGEMSDSSSVVDPKRAVEDALVLVAPELRKQKIDAEVISLPAPDLHIVETELQQILINLMINAAQAMAGGGKLTINIGTSERNGVLGAEISIMDTGPGIPADKIGKVFDPFYTTKPGKGSGLGLSISQALITRMGGLIRVKSVLGEGAKFILWYPGADHSLER